MEIHGRHDPRLLEFPLASIAGVYAERGDDADGPAGGGVEDVDGVDGAADVGVIDGGVTDGGGITNGVIAADFSSEGVTGPGDEGATPEPVAGDVDAGETLVVLGALGELVDGGAVGVVVDFGVEATTTGPGAVGDGPSGEDDGDGDDTAGVMFAPDEEGSLSGSVTLGFSTRLSDGSSRLTRSSCCTRARRSGKA